jgi:hypothetical protein
MHRGLWLSALAAGALITGCSTASPSGTEQSAVTCSAITGVNNPGTVLKLSGCTGPTGGSGTVAAPFFTPSTIHWTAGGSTTVTFNPTPLQSGGCPGGSALTLQDGRVVSSTVAGISGKLQVTFCAGAANMSLKPGTLMKF